MKSLSAWLLVAMCAGAMLVPLAAFADVEDRLRGITSVLRERQYELCRHRHFAYRHRRRFGLVCREPQATMEFAQVESRRTHAAGCIWMQSTGQGSMQSSQPVHSAAITVCMS